MPDTSLGKTSWLMEAPSPGFSEPRPADAALMKPMIKGLARQHHGLKQESGPVGAGPDEYLDLAGLEYGLEVEAEKA
jgi:hypothetical protein